MEHFQNGSQKSRTLFVFCGIRSISIICVKKVLIISQSIIQNLYRTVSLHFIVFRVSGKELFALS